MSVKQKAKELSNIPKSFENLFIKRPEGVTSKKLEGLLTKPFIIY